jgi:hypothetical protein
MVKFPTPISIESSAHCSGRFAIASLRGEFNIENYASDP